MATFSLFFFFLKFLSTSIAQHFQYRNIKAEINQYFLNEPRTLCERNQSIIFIDQISDAVPSLPTTITFFFLFSPAEIKVLTETISARKVEKLIRDDIESVFLHLFLLCNPHLMFTKMQCLFFEWKKSITVPQSNHIPQ